MEPHNQEALELAVEMERAVNPQEIEAMLRDRPWLDVAMHACWRCQDRSLKLRPWDAPPCRTHDVDKPSDYWGSRPGELALLRRILKAGVSRYHPDPIAAIAAADAERAA